MDFSVSAEVMNPVCNSLRLASGFVMTVAMPITQDQRVSQIGAPL
jgi:hypothetical protein